MLCRLCLVFRVLFRDEVHMMSVENQRKRKSRFDILPTSVNDGLQRVSENEIQLDSQQFVLEDRAYQSQQYSVPQISFTLNSNYSAPIITTEGLGYVSVVDNFFRLKLQKAMEKNFAYIAKYVIILWIYFNIFS